MKLLVLSDLQGVDHDDWQLFLTIHPERYDATVLLGDIGGRYLTTIRERFSAKPLFGVLGNHDYEGDLQYFGIEDIHARTKVVGDYVFGGLKGSIRYKNGEDAPMLTQFESSLICRVLGPVDIMIAHNSPKGIHDKPDPAHIGFTGLVEYMDQHQPKLLLHGHQHCPAWSKRGQTTIICIYGGMIIDTETLSIEIVLPL